MWFLLCVFGVGASCRSLYSFVVCLCVNGGGSIASVGDWGVWFVCCCLPVVVWFLLCFFFFGGGGGPLALGAWDGLRNFIVALPEPSICFFMCLC